jgi:putative polyhydroxyalkanoate system protein
MASIQVSYPHHRTMADARAAVQVFAAKLETKLGVKSAWQGDILMLERKGVKGSMVLKEGLVEVELTLGMMLSPMKGQIEAEVNKQLERCLG